MLSSEDRQIQATQGLNAAWQTFLKVCPLLKREFKLQEQDSEHIDFTIDGIPFTISWGEIVRPSLGRNVWEVQYNVYVWHQTKGDRWNPPEIIDTLLLTDQCINKCVKKALHTVFEVEIDGAMENLSYQLESEKETKENY